MIPIGIECLHLTENCVKLMKKVRAKAVQIYLGDTTSTSLTTKDKFTSEQIKYFKETFKKNKWSLFVHSSLRLNTCNPLSGRFMWVYANFIHDMNMSAKLGAKGVVVHLGSKKTKNYDLTEKEALNNIVAGFKYILNNSSPKSILLMETPAQQGEKVGYRLKEFAYVFNKVKNKRLGVCVDTQHIFTSGYDLRSLDETKKYFAEFDKLIGLKHLKLFHINDSLVEFHAKRDRHASIGEGYIFKDQRDTLKYICEVATKYKVPMVVETSSKYYAREMKMLNKLCQKGGKKEVVPLEIKNRAKVIKIFSELASIHLKLGNIHEATAYKRIVRSLKAGTNEGIGKRSEEKIKEIEKTGELKLLKQLKANKNVKNRLELQTVLGIGPRVSKKLINKGVRTINQLKKTQKLTKMQEMGVKYHKHFIKKITPKDIENIEKIFYEIFGNKIKVYLVGSYRTGKTEMKDADILITSNKITFDDFIKTLEDKKLLPDHIRQSRIEMLGMFKYKKRFVHIDVRFIEPKYVPFFLVFFGSGVDFSRDIRNYAKTHGYKLTQWGITDLKTKKVYMCKTERDIFKFLGLKYVEPEERIKNYKLEPIK